MAEHRKHDITTRLSHAGRAGTHVHGFVNPPIHRGSTVLVENTDMRADAGNHRLEQYLIYGVLGGPTHWALENVVAEIEGGTRCQIVSSGLAAVTTPLLAYLAAGDHCLMPDSVYGPARGFANGMMKRMGIETSFYDPCITPEGLEALIQPNTKVLYLESPGSHTFEVQDVPGLARIAHAHGAKVLMDNTWGIYHFQPFQHGVDVSIQALTKYVVGHSDVLLGSIVTNSDEDWEIVRMASLALGQYASPDDCWLALRGARTMAVRMERQFQSSLEVARWLSGRPEVKQVLHPGLPGAPGHDIWKRDFTGGCSLFGVVFQPGYSEAAMDAMVNSLELFGIGASWGGFESLALPSNLSITRSAGTGDFGGPMVRYHVGLEAPGDLIADLEQSLNVLRSNSLEKPQLD
jgi:cysteine-S-conjugate beta-lyase